MRIVITDHNDIWNHKNPLLEKYKDVVLVVCLDGKEVTDKYECLVCPNEDRDIEGNLFLDIGDPRFNRLRIYEGYLREYIGVPDEDIVILGDQKPESLYPFWALSNDAMFERLHLCAVSPWNFMNDIDKDKHRALLSNLSSLTTLFYLDSNVILSKVEPGMEYEDLKKIEKEMYENYFPKILYGIQELKRERAFFDFHADTYVPLEEGYDMLKTVKRHQRYDPEKITTYGKKITMGYISFPCDTESYSNNQEKAEALVPRLDGKKVCNYLREMRIELARANHIPFESKECPSYGPCAGTCAKCDREATYLFDKLRNIPKWVIQT